MTSSKKSLFDRPDGADGTGDGGTIGSRPFLLLQAPRLNLTVPAATRGEAAASRAQSVAEAAAPASVTADDAPARFQPNDPYFARQTFYALLGDIQTIWSEYNGAGIHVGDYDNGVDFTNPDLAAQQDASRDVVINGQALSGAPDPGTYGDGDHGTSTAGIIAASGNNGVGVIGVAWGATLTSVNIFDPNSPININALDFGVTANFLSAVHQETNFGVTNNSWNDTANYESNENPNVASSIAAEISTEYAYVSANGRGGLGTLIVQSAGNDNVDANGVGLNASRYTITVGAIDLNGVRSSYSNYGSSILVTAVGTDIPGTVVTTDETGSAGDNAGGTNDGFDGTGDYTATFNGTSASGPMVTGIVALMLQANPNLGWRDVQNILALSASYTYYPTSSNWRVNGADDWNGGGDHISVAYGYGEANAYNSVRMAEAAAYYEPVAQTSANEQSYATGLAQPAIALAANGTTTYSFNVAQSIDVEHVDLTLGITSSKFYDLTITLTSPDGTVETVYKDNDTSYNPGKQIWTYGLDGLRGELSAGTWTLSITDSGNDTGTLNAAGMTIYGSTPSDAQVYHYTDEFHTMVAQDASRATLTTMGSDGWIDASTLHSASTVDLGAGTGTIDNTAFTIGGSGVANVIGGDGGDTLMGSADANELVGMRGDDIVTGSGGNDALDGGDGADTLYGDGSVVSGIGFGSGMATKASGAGNTGAATAIDVTDDFSLAANADIGDSTGTPHVSIAATADGNADYYALAVAAGTSLVFDVDHAGYNIRHSLTLYGPNGSQLAYNEINSGFVQDPGSDGVFDSYLTYTTTVAGTYDIAVGATSVNYVLQISASAYAGGFSGSIGNDVLDGGIGADMMVGGLGDDTYDVDDPGDQVVENAGEGTDTVHATISYTLPQNVENLVLDSADPINGTGNDRANTITGGGGNNVIDGGTGADSLHGLGGDDTYDVDNAGDNIYEAVGGGTDTVLTTVSYTLLAGQEIETFATTDAAGTSAIKLTGNAFAQTITGNAAANVIDGGGGADTLYGLGGGDTFLFDTALGAGNIDSIADFTPSTLTSPDTIALSQAIFTALTAGPLAAGAFQDITSTSETASARILYNHSTGGLFYDPDGNASTNAAVQFATLTSKPTLTTADFKVIAAHAPPDDFNGDGRSDIFFRDDANGPIGYATINSNGTSTTWHPVGTSGTAYALAGIGDVNGDGKSDILFRNNSGTLGYDTINSNGTSVTFHAVGPSSTAYAVAGVGDFNGDGTSDILFRNTSNGALGYDTINSNGTSVTFHAIGASSTAYAAVGVGDFNGDGVSDILFRNNSNGAIGYDTINSNGTSVTFHAIGPSGTAYSVAGIGDFNGDGLADILFRNANGALGYDTINGNGTSTTFHAIGASGTAYAVVGTGDYTGDGVSDILFRNNSNGALGYDTINGNGTSTTFHPIGTSNTAYTVHS